MLESSIVTDENPSDGDFVMIVRKKRVSSSPVNASAIASTRKNPRICMIGVRSSSYLSVVYNSVSRKSLSPYLTLK